MENIFIWHWYVAYVELSAVFFAAWETEHSIFKRMRDNSLKVIARQWQRHGTDLLEVVED